MTRKCLWLATVVLLTRSVGGFAQDRVPRSPSSEQQMESGSEKWEHDPALFTRRDRSVIRAYYEACRGGSHCQSDTRGSECKGDDRWLRKNSMLPREMHEKIKRLPGALEKRLQPLESRYLRGTIGSDMVMVDELTHRLKDLICGIAGGMTD